MTSPDAAALAAAEHLTRACVAALATPVAAVILHGSLATGDFQPGRSDIDLLVVADGPLSRPEIAALTTAVRDADLGGATGIDLHVVTSPFAAAPRPPAAMELHIGRYEASSPLLEVEPKVVDAPDLWAELSMARADGRSLYGAPAPTVLGEIPAAYLRERGRYWLRTWHSRTDDTAHAALMVLTACRIWHFAREGTHCSKLAAGEWALTRDSSLTAVSQAIRQRTVDPDAPIDEAGIRRVLETVLRDTAP